jgi:dCMP deaminase
MSTIISFVPALHAGYINFFKKHPDTLYLLDSDFVTDFTRLERDLRQINSLDMKKAIESLGIFKKVEVLHIIDIKNLKLEGEIIMPDEDITRELKEKYFKNTEVNFEKIFLRWEKQISLTENIVPPDRVISTDEFDKEVISIATNEAKKSSDWWRQVGAAIVKEGKVIMAGYNRHVPSDMSMDVYGDPRSSFDAGIRFDLSTAIHGEASLVARAAKEGLSLDGTSIYVTTFPCPGCAKLIVDAGINKVFYQKGYSLLDSENILKSANVEIVMVKMD